MVSARPRLRRAGLTALIVVGWSGLAGADHWAGGCGDLLDVSLRAGRSGTRALALGDRLGLGGLLLVGRRLGEGGRLEAPREVALEAANALLFCSWPLGLFASEVGALVGGVVLGAGDGDDVQRVVELGGHRRGLAGAGWR